MEDYCQCGEKAKRKLYTNTCLVCGKGIVANTPSETAVKIKFADKNIERMDLELHLDGKKEDSMGCLLVRPSQLMLDQSGETDQMFMEIKITRSEMKGLLVDLEEDWYLHSKYCHQKKMRACPFCGGDDIVGDLGEGTRDGEKYYCSGCCDCTTLGPEAKTVKEAIEAWNSRA